jgi:hypothetical protein
MQAGFGGEGLLGRPMLLPVVPQRRSSVRSTTASGPSGRRWSVSRSDTTTPLGLRRSLTVWRGIGKTPTPLKGRRDTITCACVWHPRCRASGGRARSYSFGRSRVHAPSLFSGARGPRTAPVDYPPHGDEGWFMLPHFPQFCNSFLPAPGVLARWGPGEPGVCEAWRRVVGVRMRPAAYATPYDAFPLVYVTTTGTPTAACRCL